MATNAVVTLQSIEALYTTAAETTNARVTKAQSEVVWAQSALATNARVTKAWVEVVWQESTGESVADEIEFTDVATAQAVFNASASDTITFTDEAVRSEKPGNTLALTETLALDIVKSVDMTDTLVLADTLAYNHVQARVLADVVALADTAVVNRTLPTKSVSDTITFTDDVDESRPAVDLVSFTQVASAVVTYLGGTLDDMITFTDVATPLIVLTTTPTSTLVLADIATVDTVFEPSPTDTLALIDSAVASKNIDYLLLQAPFSAVAESIILPNPELQDAENLTSGIDDDYALDGTMYTYVRRHDSRRIDYTFRMSRQEALDIQSFLDLYDAEEMRLTNWKGEVWRVKLDTNPVVFSHNRRGAPDGIIETHLTFEGTKISG